MLICIWNLIYFHSAENLEYLVRYDIVESDRCLPTSRRTLLPRQPKTIQKDKYNCIPIKIHVCRLFYMCVYIYTRYTYCWHWNVILRSCLLVSLTIRKLHFQNCWIDLERCLYYSSCVGRLHKYSYVVKRIQFISIQYNIQMEVIRFLKADNLVTFCYITQYNTTLSYAAYITSVNLKYKTGKSNLHGYMCENRNTQEVFVGEPDWKRELGTRRRRQEDNIKMYLKVIE
jgi:hypothetical protein